MTFNSWTTRAVLLASFATAIASPALADDASDIAALKARVADLEKKENDNWMTNERAAQIKAIVNDVLKDAASRPNGSGGFNIGYKDGFYIQGSNDATHDVPDFKLVFNGYLQARYEFANHNPNTSGGTLFSDGIDVRRARVSFSGNVFSPDITFKLEGDFYGGSAGTALNTASTPNTLSTSSGNFLVTDAFVGYRFTDQLKVKAGSFKVPFAKAELTADPYLGMIERPEVLNPFDPVRALGVSLYGDIIKDQFSYDANINDGGNSNIFRRVDTSGATPNLDNRLAYYARLQYSPTSIKDFADEPDLRKDTSTFVWLIGAAAGYESQTGAASPSPQTTTTLTGLSNVGGTKGYAGSLVVNGDIYKATADFSAKYMGFAFNSAIYFQQLNQATLIASPAIATSSTYEYGGYGQVGYFIVPNKVELVGRAGALASEFGPNISDYYTVGVNYYLYGHNAKIGADVTYMPDTAYTDAATSQLQNTSAIVGRVQFQVKF